MKQHSNTLAAFAAVLTLFAIVPPAAVADVTEAQIASAKTPADHEAIAQSYDADAAAAQAEASKHEAMARAYQSAGGPKKSGPNSMERHCDRLAKSYTDAAADYRALAAEHRSMAQDVAK